VNRRGVVAELIDRATPALAAFCECHALAARAAAALRRVSGLQLTAREIEQMLMAESGLDPSALSADAAAVDRAAGRLAESAQLQRAAVSACAQGVPGGAAAALAAQASWTEDATVRVSSAAAVLAEAADALERIVTAKFEAITHFAPRDDDHATLPEIRALVGYLEHADRTPMRDVAALASPLFAAVPEVPVCDLAAAWLAEVFIPHIEGAEQDFADLCRGCEDAVADVLGRVAEAVEPLATVPVPIAAAPVPETPEPVPEAPAPAAGVALADAGAVLDSRAVLESGVELADAPEALR
jgi:hypothetical protein